MVRFFQYICGKFIKTSYMKAFYAAACAASLFALVSCGQKNSIEGSIAGVESDTVYVSYSLLGQARAPRTMDTVALVEGKLIYNMPDTGSYYVNIIPAPKTLPGNAQPAIRMQGVTFYYFPGDKLQVTATITPDDVDQMITGSDVYTKINAFQSSIEGLNDAWDETYARYVELNKQKAGDSLINLTRDSLLSIQGNIAAIRQDYIRNNPNSQISALFLSYVPVDSVASMVDLLSEEVKNGKFKYVVDQVMVAYARNEKLKAAKENTAPGKPAPDFTLNDLEGKPFTLSSLYGKGKYIVLDFWGSWCGWCIKGIPDMKKYYEKYGKTLEIVGIDCGDTEEKWKEAVKKYELPWIGVYNTQESDVPTMYAVSGYPTKVVIDPEGKIVETVVGESPKFYELIDSLMKK